MKKFAILAIVLLTTSCAVSEEAVIDSETAPSTTLQSQSPQGADNGEISLDPLDVESLETTDEQDPADNPGTTDQPTQENPSRDDDGELEIEADQNSEPNQSENDSEAAPETTPETDVDPVDTAPPARETVNSYIDLLRVAPEVTSGYDRDLFRHWVDADGDGCHAREETLIAESVGSVSVSGDCDISGTWFSAFDGETTTNPSNFDVDHLVPLKEAWDSGANRWDSDTRERFANDLGSPHSLIAVSRGSNRSKGAKDPAEWMPPRQSYTCEYIFTWTLVKIRWSLTADQAEINALRANGGDCFVDEMNFSSAVSEAEIIAGNPPEPEPTPEPTPEADGELDPRFSFCTEAKAAGYGPYVRGVDPEYEWYRDGDSDGTVCE